MSAQDGNKLSKALDRLIDHFSDKYDITYAETIGVLQMKIMDLWDMAPKEAEEADDV
jgi:hypothetical protein